MIKGTFQKVVITSEYITLGQLLKLTKVISNGGEEKHYLSTHKSIVNGLPENRRGRKLRPGDQVVVDEGSFEIAR